MAMRGNEFIRVELDLPVAVAEMLVAVGAAAAAALDPDAADQRADQVAALAAAAIVAIANGVRQGLGGEMPPVEPPPVENATQQSRIIADVLAAAAAGEELRVKDIGERLAAAGADWRRARLNSALWWEAHKPNGRLRSTRHGYYRLTPKDGDDV
jgi:hypothetical protein